MGCMRRLSLWGLVLLLITAGCAHAQENGGGEAAPMVSLTIEPEDATFDPWTVVKGTLTVKNVSDQPVLLVGGTFETNGGKNLAGVRMAAKQPGAGVLEPGKKIQIKGTLMEDQVGAAARLPRPPHWEWHGRDELLTFRLLWPGESVRREGTFRARYDVGDGFVASVRVVAVPTDSTVWVKTVDEKKEIDVGNAGMGRGMTPTVEVRAVYEKQEGFERPKKDPEKAAELPLLGTHFAPFALTPEEFETLEKGSRTVEAKTPFQIEHFDFDLAEAREKAGIAKGSHTRSLASACWVLLGEGKTALVTPDRVLRVSGNALPLADQLNKEDKVWVRFFSGAEEEDPGENLAYFEKKGFKTSSHMEKGGGYGGGVTVEDARLLEFLEALEERGLEMDGKTSIRGS